MGGLVEKSCQQPSRQFSVLTYWNYGSHVNNSLAVLIGFGLQLIKLVSQKNLWAIGIYIHNSLHIQA